MTPTEALQNHLNLCDELYQLALEENRFLKQQQHVPDAPLRERKRALLGRLDDSLAHLKATPPPAGSTDPDRKQIIEKARARILQILHVDRENEQLLLRYSLGARPVRPAAPTPVAVATPNQIQRLYDRHA